MRGQNGPFHVQIPLLLGHFGPSWVPSGIRGFESPTGSVQGTCSKGVKKGSKRGPPRPVLGGLEMTLFQ